MRHFSELSDLGPAGLVAMLDASDKHLRDRSSNCARPLARKNIALVFEKASTRTRLSLEVAVAELGGHPIVIAGATSQLGRGEPIADTARVLGRMVNAITFRTSGHDRLLQMMQFAGVPVLNALTDDSHPMQLLADLMTVRRVSGDLSRLRYAWIGDGNNMANSWIEAAGLLGLELRLACPEGYDPSPRELARARERGARIEVVRRPEAAAEGADVISTDVFSSMGQEAEAEARRRAFLGFCVDEELVARANPTVIVLHCLPAHRGEEISAAVLEGPRSVVWEQAEARLHTAKAALCWALGVDD
ncbi:MAG: ornithine carbamoyltransferase [Polyangiaceae bacterium]|nr:ornithine carbamoyltransferase [Polyangiaceae bacterium]